MDSPKKQSKRSLLNHLNGKLAKFPERMILQDWIDEASKITPGMEKALEGVYCGHEGKINELVEGLSHEVYITMGWYTVTTAPRVEYAYFS